MAQDPTTAQPADTQSSSAAASGSAENPLRKGLRMARTPQPCVLIIFGASGDLTNRKLLPALWALSRNPTAWSWLLGRWYLAHQENARRVPARVT